MIDAAEMLRSSNLKVKIDQKKNIIFVGIEYHDGLMASRLVGAYLEALREKIQQDVRAEADSNRRYLESLLPTLLDPQMRDKVQNMIGIEIEKATLVSSRSFDLLEAAIPPKKRIKPKRRKMVITGFFLGCIMGFAAAYLNSRFSLRHILKPGA